MRSGAPLNLLFLRSVMSSKIIYVVWVLAIKSVASVGVDDLKSVKLFVEILRLNEIKTAVARSDEGLTEYPGLYSSPILRCFFGFCSKHPLILKHFRQLSILMHRHENITASNKFSVHIQLRDRGPV